MSHGLFDKGGRTISESEAILPQFSESAWFGRYRSDVSRAIVIGFCSVSYILEEYSQKHKERAHRAGESGVILQFLNEDLDRSGSGL